MNEHVRERAGATRRELLAMGGAAALGALAPGAGRAQSTERTLRVATPALPQGLDVRSSLGTADVDWAGAFHDRLVQFGTMPDPDNPGARREDIGIEPSRPGGHRVQGLLAAAWECAADGKALRFQLRQGVRSHHGNVLGAHDVKYSLERKLATEGADCAVLRAMGLATGEQVQVEGPNTVSLRVDTPNPLLLVLCGHLSLPVLDSVMCRQMATRDDAWARRFLREQAAGFGPYRPTAFVAGRHLLAEAHAGYHGRAPFFDHLVVRELPHSATRLALLKAGTVDVAQALTPHEMKSLDSDPRLAVSSFDSSSMLCVHLNNWQRPLDDPKVRRALNHAFSRQDLLDTVMQGFGRKPAWLLPPCYPGAAGESRPYDTDIAKSRSLLTQSGFPHGFTTEMVFNGANPIEEPIALVLQAALKEIGVQLKLRKLAPGAYFDSLASRRDPMVLHHDTCRFPDPGLSLDLSLRASSRVNHSGYYNTDVNRLIEAGRSTLATVERMAAVKRAQELVLAEAPWVFVGDPGFQLAHGTDIRGLTYYTSNRLSFQDVVRA